jgi:hypothetical protein
VLGYCGLRQEHTERKPIYQNRGGRCLPAAIVRRFPQTEPTGPANPAERKSDSELESS